MYHLDDEICRYINSKYHLNITIDEMEGFRKDGLHLRGSNENLFITEIDTIDRIYSNHIEKIIETCQLRKWSLDVYYVLITGGGGEALYSTIKREFIPHAVLSSSPLFDNLIGLTALAKKVC
jgi:hypothetical protein